MDDYRRDHTARDKSTFEELSDDLLPYVKRRRKLGGMGAVVSTSSVLSFS